MIAKNKRLNALARLNYRRQNIGSDYDSEYDEEDYGNEYGNEYG